MEFNCFLKRIFKRACSFIRKVRVVGYSMFRASKKEFPTKYIYYFEEHGSSDGSEQFQIDYK